MISFNFIPKFSLQIFIAFICFTIVGTLTHELGHITVAESLGYDTKLYYGSMIYEANGLFEDELYKEFNSINETYKGYEPEDVPKEVLDRTEYLSNELAKNYKPILEKDRLFVTIGGPAQTILTSLIGLLILHFTRKKQNINFETIDWLGAFLSLFILREVFNFFSALASRILYGDRNFNGDEFKISRYFGYNQWVIPSIILMIGLAVALFVIFRIIPIKYRFSFIIAGFFGGLLGFALWFKFLGPIVLPVY